MQRQKPIETMNKTLDTPFVFFELDNKILIASYKPNVTITLKNAKEIVASRLSFIEKSMPALILNQGIIKINKEARDYFTSDEGIAGVKCAALLVNSNFISLTTNFFLKITKTKLLVKTFTDKQEALAWLANFID
jgi:hypothetical protein